MQGVQFTTCQSEQSLFLIVYGPLFGLLFAVVAFAFTFVAAVAARIALGNVVRVYPETIQGLTFYCSKIYITKILACVTSVVFIVESSVGYINNVLIVVGSIFSVGFSV